MTVQWRILLKTMHRFPLWLKQAISDPETKDRIHALSDFRVNTVCQQAHCPNINSCLKNSELTFMILGDKCTRDCRFCAVEKNSGNSLTLDSDEPKRVGEMVESLGLKYVVVTSVTRDDLDDGGASQFVRVIDVIRQIDKRIGVEVLIPDFRGDTSSIEMVVNAYPTVIAHNLETVENLHGKLKPRSSYKVSLDVLRRIKIIDCDMITKSSLMLGLGESRHDILASLEDLRSINCDILTLGQYLAPSNRHYPVKEFINPQQFNEYRDIALGMGFKAVYSAPLSRSSYQAEQLYNTVSYV